MEFMLNIELKKPTEQISYRDKILLTGSCFTEHIGDALTELKFSVLQNPNGILYDPASVCKSLISYVHNYQYRAEDLFYLNEVWNSWSHHSRFSHINKEACLAKINASQQQAHAFLKEANWLLITLGSAFSYELQNVSLHKVPWGGCGVANCHRAPAQWFRKRLLQIDEIIAMLRDCVEQLQQLNAGLKIIFTVSPVRHIRDGVVDNNRSKARLIESVHHIVHSCSHCHYFPAYELVIDVLRDYRFYDADLVHPNYAATEFVLEKFTETCIDSESKQLMEEIRKIVIAARHKPFQPETQGHKQFLLTHLEKAKKLQEQYPFLNLARELSYFSQSAETL
jgi:hypothetical protein